jgi:uncharacterized protein (DUF362 family)
MRLVPTVIIADAATDADIGATVARAGLWDVIAATSSSAPSVVILVDIGGYWPDDPSQLDPRAVEMFIDSILAHTPGTVTIAASADSSSLWAGNRDVYARAELAGYRYATDAGHSYDIIDLGEETRDDVFAPGSSLANTPASIVWLNADVRIVLAALRTDQTQGFAAGLQTLLGALPLANKTLHYWQRRDVGEVAAELLDTMPPHFTLIDARRIADGADGRREGSVQNAGLVIASRSPLLADLAAGLKLGLDPHASRLVAQVARAHPLPPAHRFEGSLAPLEGLVLASPIATRHARARDANEMVASLTEPWLQPLDTTLFPHLRPLDARVNGIVANLLQSGASGTGLRLALDALVAAGASAAQSWQTLFAKHMLTRKIVPLGIDPKRLPPSAFTQMVEELDSLVPLARDAPERGEGLRWRKLGGAVIFDYTRDLAIPFDCFVAAVDVGRAIQFMNDYLGGVIVPVEYDVNGRPVRQAERNLYLPQPNYLALFGGQPIDVTKIEAVRREIDAHHLYWKTLFSTNGSAAADDGIISFARSEAGTSIRIIGRQDFTLPPFWDLFDIRVVPTLEISLTTRAYQIFFDRTLANFEALVEGRDIAIGRSPDTPFVPAAMRIEEVAGRLLESVEPWLARIRARPRPTPDADGFVHVAPN